VYVNVDLAATSNSVQLREPDHFREFKVVVVGHREERTSLEQALRPFGRLDNDGYAWIRRDAVERLAGERSTNPDWSGSLDGLVAYAQSHGWVDSAGDLRAHCEWTGEVA